MTTTPKNIDYNGLKINSLDDTTNLSMNAISSSTGILLNYDLLTTPKQFIINVNGFTLSTNTSSFQFVCYLQQLLQALGIPPNSTTLKIIDRIMLSDGISTVFIHENGGVLTFNVNTGGYVNFLQVPKCLSSVSNGNDLTKKSYVDNLALTRGTILDQTGTQSYYLIYADGTTNELYNGTNGDTNGFLYNTAGNIQAQRLYIVTGNTRVRIGSVSNSTNALRNSAHSVCIGEGMIETSDTTANLVGALAIGWDCCKYLVPINVICIGNRAGQTFSNPSGTTPGSSQGVVCIGTEAGFTNPTRFSNFIGYQAGYFIQTPQSTGAIGEVCIGYQAGYSTTTTAPNSVSIGYQANYSNRPATSVCLNATGTPLSNTTNGTFTVKPIRGFVVSGAPSGELFYDDTGSFTGLAGEIYYAL